jgi:hypothetical protein
MVHSPVIVGALNSRDIARVLNNTDYASVPVLSLANRAKLIVGKVAADLTLLDFSVSVSNSICKFLCLGIAEPKHIKRHTLSGFMPYSLHTLKLVY